jgi:hypothetical protein
MRDTCGPLKVVIKINHNLWKDELMSCIQGTILRPPLIKSDYFNRSALL